MLILLPINPRTHPSESRWRDSSMKLLAHRGIWKAWQGAAPQAKNSLAALGLALHHGYGVETDIRDLDGELVISHDMPTRAGHVNLDAFLCLCRDTPQAGLLALNIKSAGLDVLLKSKLEQYGITRYFVFDMSVPDTLGYRRLGMPYAVRWSELEDGGRLLDETGYVWLDAFEDDSWYSNDLIRALLDRGKTVAVVSPELHGRPHEQVWMRLRELAPADSLYLCTDLVAQAQEVFHV